MKVKGVPSKERETEALLGSTATPSNSNWSDGTTNAVLPSYSSLSGSDGDSPGHDPSDVTTTAACINVLAPPHLRQNHHVFDARAGDKQTNQEDNTTTATATTLSSPIHSPWLKTVSIALVCSITSFVTYIAIHHNNHSSTTSQTMMSDQTLLGLLGLSDDVQNFMTTKKSNNKHHAHEKEEIHQSFFDTAYSSITNEPLSHKSPADLGIPIYDDRPDNSRPGSVFGSVQNGSQVGHPLPTNEWYLNLVVGLDDSPGPDDRYENFVGEENRVYAIPYILDTVGTVVGIRLHYPNVMSYGTVVQSIFVNYHGLTLGTVDEGFTRRYRVDEGTLPSKLGVGLQWDNQEEDHPSQEQQQQHYMRSSILRGMPYGTMEYAPGVKPTIASEIIAELPIVDGATRLQCGTLDSTSRNEIVEPSDSVLVERDVELYFPESDFTWLVFASRPVYVTCYVNPDKYMGSISLPPGAAKSVDNPNAFQLRMDPARDNAVTDIDDEPLIVRIALANNCTSGTNVNFCDRNKPQDQSSYVSILRGHAAVYPTSPTVKYAYSNPEGGLAPEESSYDDGKSAYLFFDWAAKSYLKQHHEPEKELIMFALPHHVDILRRLDGQSSNEVVGHCMRSLHGNACLVKGGLWAMEEELGGLPNFMAPRPPNHASISALAEALSKDIAYSLPENYMRGAGDTYFSGKMLAKLGRIIVIAQELRGLAETPDSELPDPSTADGKELLAIIQKCKEVTLPTEEEVTTAVERLRKGVEVWLNGEAAAKYTYDNTWGGLVNCGCLFNGEGCDNVFPGCPAYTDPGLNFGNGMYNDHHFHYGYHIYAAAIVAEYDRDWGKRYFELVQLYIRDIANPSVDDKHFPVFRQKDWYLGNSWASGIALIGGRPYLNGRNQESSSEAIAAYEGIAMFGSVMMKSFGNGKSASQSDNDNAYTSLRIFNIGRFLATTEIRSADRYWHVYSPKRDQIYPDSYTPAVVSMMWDTMCQFQTWFGSAPYLAYGIQLLPLTPVSERRDSDQWIRQLYPSYVESCEADANCVNEGWSVMLYAVLASLGHQDMAMDKALALHEDVFTSAGGSGHSLSNTLWYIATRPSPSVPYDLEEPSTSINSKPVSKADKKNTIIECGCPDACTSKVLKKKVDGITCKERIMWLMANKGFDELGACGQVAGGDYQSECGLCNPAVCAAPDATTQDAGQVPASAGCPPCHADVCRSDINRCQITTAPFLCYEGDSKGGCSPTPWDGSHCSSCCALFKGCEG